ncbi:MAG: hypothetical protein ACI3YX_06955 [Prevotella sp.]
MKTTMLKSMAIAIMMFTIYSCSEDEESIVPKTAMSIVQTTINGPKDDSYLPLDSIPENMAKEMDAEELAIWEKLCSRYYVKKNTFNTDFYKKNKAAVLKRFEVLYNFSIEKKMEPVSLSFIWEENEANNKNANHLLTYSYSDCDSTENDTPIMNDSTEVSYDVKYGSASLYYYVDTRYGYGIDVSADFKVTDNGYCNKFEQTSESRYQLYPSMAYMEMGSCSMSIDENGLAFTIIYGTFRYGIYSKNINFNHLMDLCELLPQC